ARRRARRAPRFAGTGPSIGCLGAASRGGGVFLASPLQGARPDPQRPRTSRRPVGLTLPGVFILGRYKLTAPIVSPPGSIVRAPGGAIEVGDALLLFPAPVDLHASDRVFQAIPAIELFAKDPVERRGLLLRLDDIAGLLAEDRRHFSFSIHAGDRSPLLVDQKRREEKLRRGSRVEQIVEDGLVVRDVEVVVPVEL